MPSFSNCEDFFSHLQSLSVSGRLSSGYILAAGTPLAKEDFVFRFAKFLENETKTSSRLLNDFSFFGSEEGTIGIDEVRTVKRFLSSKPVKSSRRVAAFKNAERLTPESQNALLKISEDPFSSSLIFLLVNNRGSLLPTLNSRFEHFFFPAIHFPDYLSTSVDVQSAIVRGRELSRQFISASPSTRFALIKKIAEEDKKNENASASSEFLKSLILELNKNPLKNSSTLKKVLVANTDLSKFNLNRRLRLLALAEDLK